MEKGNASGHWARKAEESSARLEQLKGEKWERRKRLADALVSFVERVTDPEHTATDGELRALPGVADACSRLL